MIYGHGGDIYTYKNMLDFSVNVNPLGPPACAVEAAKRGAELMTVYPDSGCRELRKKLSGMQSIQEMQYIFGNGAADLIYRLVLAEKPKKALIPVPAFSEYEQALKTVGCEITYYETKPDQCFCIDSHFLEKLDEQYDMVFLCSPTNPSGQVIDKDLLIQVAEICAARRIRMVLDECFIEFLENAEAVSMLRETERYSQIFLLRAFTKIYAMPGIRLGYGVSSDTSLLGRMEESGQPWSVSVPAQMAGTAVLDENAYVQEARRLISEERQFLENELNSMGIKFISSKANFILLYTDIDLFGRLKLKGILIRDCANYRGLGKGWYRIAIRTHEENKRLTDALKLIKEASR